MSDARSTIDLLIEAAEPAARAAVLDRLAERLGGEALLLLVRDPELGKWLPAPGAPQTIRGGRSWRDFLRSCAAPGRYDGEVEIPLGRCRRVIGIVVDAAAAVLLGGTPQEPEIEELERQLPLLAALLRVEQEAQLAKAQAAAAWESASRTSNVIKALESARAEAARLNAELRAEHDRKDSFLATLGHELRNPLAPLANSVELLGHAGLAPEMHARQLDVMRRQVHHLTHLVDDLLDVSRVSRGRVDLRREPLALGEVLRHALDEARPLLEARRHECVYREPREPLFVSADRVRLAQVFGNLINNAAKYTDEGGLLTITVERDGSTASIRFTDTGIGIEAEMLPHVFDLFAQAPDVLSRAGGGLGIGLTLVRTLVELHEGRVSAHSEGPGQGSTFEVCLPLTDGARAEPEQAPTRAQPQGALRAIVCDDNKDAADSLCALLVSMGHEVRVTYDAAATLALVERWHSDTAIIDLGLPGMDGFELARRLRRGGYAGRLIALTGYGTGEARRRSEEAGFDAHLVKPVGLGALAELLSAAPAPKTGRPL